MGRSCVTPSGAGNDNESAAYRAARERYERARRLEGVMSERTLAGIRMRALQDMLAARMGR